MNSFLGPVVTARTWNLATARALYEKGALGDAQQALQNVEQSLRQGLHSIKKFAKESDPVQIQQETQVRIGRFEGQLEDIKNLLL